jgi:NAD(P)H-quinone oxidoreductase subunit 5
MWSQVKVKRTLAWSTVGQMGFMMVECGLAVFPAALLHVVGHGFYKAWSFLRSGELPRPSGHAERLTSSSALAWAAAGMATALPTMTLASRVTGFEPWHSPGELAMAGILAVAIGQLWLAILGQREARGGPRNELALAIVVTLVVVHGGFWIYRGMSAFLEPVIGEPPIASGWLPWATAIVPLTTIWGLAVLQAILPILSRHRLGRAFYVHAIHGFYLGAVADRLVAIVWKSTGRLREGVQGV